MPQGNETYIEQTQQTTSFLHLSFFMDSRDGLIFNGVLVKNYAVNGCRLSLDNHSDLR